MIQIRYVFIGILLGASLTARGGTIQTRSGEKLSGDVVIAGQKVTVRTQDGRVRQFDLDQLSDAVFAPEVVDTSGAVATKKEEPKARNILAEYFADADFKQRVLARYEAGMYMYFPHKEIPDPVIPARFCVRYTTRLVASKSGGYALQLVTRSGARLWVNDKLRIDRWTPKRPIDERVALELKAREPVSIRLETMTGESEYYLHLAWHGPGLSNVYIPSENFLRPSDRPNEAPMVKLVSPADDSSLVAPKSVVLEAQASDSDGKVAAVEFLCNRTLLGSVKSPPYRMTWNQPPAGNHIVTVKAIDDKGLASYSRHIDVSIGGRGSGGTLPAPWGDQTVSEKRGHPSEGSAGFAGGVFRLNRGGGLILEGHDSVHFVYQPVKGDFTLVAKVKSLGVADEMAGAMAGLMIRDSMNYKSRAAAVLTGVDHTYFVRRQDTWNRPGSTERNLAAPCWLKLIRHGNRVRGYSSQDGKSWMSMGSEKLEINSEALVGLCAMSRNGDKPCEAQIEQVALTKGSPAMSTTSPGILLRDGTFLSCQVQSVKDNHVFYDRNGKERIPLRLDKVARLVYQPMLEELAVQLPQGQTGVLLASGDFVEGEVKEISYRVTVSTVLFGNRIFNIRTDNQVTAICLHEPEPAKGYQVTAKDGSVYRTAAAPRIEADVLKLESAMVGAVELPVRDLVRMRME